MTRFSGALSRAGIAVFAGVLLLSLFPPAPAGSAEALQEITVKEGDTLWSIAQHYLKDPNRWPEILKHNQLPLSDPTAALPGSKLKIPVQLIKESLRKADLVYILNEVLYRKRDKAIWNRAYSSLDLYNEDSLRTMEKAQANVRFYDGNLLKLDQNSLAVLRPELKREEVTLKSGGLHVSKAKVITPTAVVTPQSGDTVYKARVRDDKATVVLVEKGSTEVLGLDTGKTVTVSEGFANITLAGRDPSVPVKVGVMAGFAMPEFNDEGELILPKIASAREDRPKRTEEEKKKKRETVPGESARPPEDPRREESDRSRQYYRVQVSPDADFKNIVWDKTRKMEKNTDVADPADYGLANGDYYRRISYIDSKGKESAFSSLDPVTINTRVPELKVLSPREGLRTGDGFLRVEGTAEKGLIVTVNGLPVKVEPDGKFYWSVVLVNAGPNKIKVVAKDLEGNKAEVVRTVIYKK